MVGLLVVLLRAPAHAQQQAEWQCTSDAECGGLLCKSGACVEPPTKRRSVPMMLGGGAMIAAGAMLVLAGGYRTQGQADETRSIMLVVGGATLVAGGITLVIIGKKRVAVAPTGVTLTPYWAPHGAGLGLHLAL